MNKILSILWSYVKTKYLRRFSHRQALEAWQNKQVTAYLKAVLPNSPFYRSHYKDHDLTQWQQLPTINKSVMMANFDRLNTVGITQSAAMTVARQAETSRDFSPTLQGYTVGLSSGTSGNRGLFLISQAEQQSWAGTILAKALPQSILTPQRIAFFLRANSNLYETVQRSRIQFEYFDLFQPLESHITRLNQYQPTILVAPASMLRLLANNLLANNLLTAHLPAPSLDIAPIKLISVAEVLDPLDEQFIQAAFNQPVHQLYQCTEGFLAATCEQGTLHLNEDILVIQKDYLDSDSYLNSYPNSHSDSYSDSHSDSRRFSPIITDFNRTTQPIIRYRLDDILTERSAPCPCGSILTAIEQIEGRCDDIFYLPSLSHNRSESTDQLALIPVFPDFIRRTIILASDSIEEYAAIQTANGIEIYLKLTEPSPQKSYEQKSYEQQWKTLTTQLTEQLTILFNQLGCKSPPIAFLPYQPQTQQGQKLRRIRRDRPHLP